MAGIGEAASIWAFATAAWSFAEAITQYTKDFKGVPEELEGLDGEIRDTVSLVSELRDLVHQNEVTKCWSDEGIRRAQKCIVDCQGVLGTLRNLLQKAGVSTEVEITKEDLDIGLLVQAKWPIAYKQQLTDARAKLDRVYTRIQIAQTSYLIPTMPTRVEKEKSMKTLAQLLRSEEEAGKGEVLRKEARKKQKQKQKQKQRQSQRRHSMYSNADFPFKAYSQASTTGGQSRVQSYYDGSIYASSLDSSENEDKLTLEKKSTMYEEFCKDLLQMARDELAVEEAEKAAKERALQEQRQAAIHAYQDYVRQQRMSRELKRQELRAQLDGKLAAAQVDDIVALQFPDTGEDEDPQAALMASRVNAKKLPAIPISYLDDNLPVLTKTPTKAKVAPAPRGAGSFSSKFKRIFSGGKNRSMDRTGANAIPLDLQEILSPSGKARLKGFVIGSNGDDKMRPTEFDVPESWLLQRLSERGKSGIRKSGTHYSPWDEFALLPQSYRKAIDDVMYEQAARGFLPYSLLYVERIFEEKRRSLFGRRQIPELKAVYVVLKPRISSTSLDWPQSDIGRLDGTAKERPYQISLNQPQDQLPSKSMNELVFERDDSNKDKKPGSNADSEPFEKRVTDFIKSSSKRLNGAEADRRSDGPSYSAHGQQAFPNDVKPASPAPVYSSLGQYQDLTSTGRYAPPGFYPQIVPPVNTRILPYPGVPQYYTGVPPSDPYVTSVPPHFTSPVLDPRNPTPRPASRSHVSSHLPNTAAAESRPTSRHEDPRYGGIGLSVNGVSVTGPHDHMYNPSSLSVYNESPRSKYEHRSRKPIRQSTDGTSRSRSRDAYSTVDSGLYSYLSSGSLVPGVRRTRRVYSGDSYNPHSPINDSPIYKDVYRNGEGESKHRKTYSDSVRISTTQLNEILASKVTSKYKHPTTETVVDVSSEEEIVSKRSRPRLRFKFSEEDTTLATEDSHLKPNYPSHSKKHYTTDQHVEIESPLEMDVSQSTSLPKIRPRVEEVEEDDENEWWGGEKPERRTNWQSQSAQGSSAEANRVTTNIQQNGNSKVARFDSDDPWEDKPTTNDKELAARYLSGLVNHEITNGSSPSSSMSQNRQPKDTTTNTREGNQTPREGEDVSLLRFSSSPPSSVSKPNTPAGQEKNARNSASHASTSSTTTSKTQPSLDAAHNPVNHTSELAAIVAATAPVAPSASSVAPLEQPPPSIQQSGGSQAGTDDKAAAAAAAGDTESTTTEEGRAAVNGRVTDLSAPRYRPSELVEMLSVGLTEPPRRADSSTATTEKDQEVDNARYTAAAEAARLRLEEQSRRQTHAKVELELLKLEGSNNILPRSSSGASITVSIPGSVAASIPASSPLTPSHGAHASALTATTSASARQVSSPSISGSTELGVNASNPESTVSGSNVGGRTGAGTTATAAAAAGAAAGPGSGPGSRTVSSSTVMRRRSAGSEDEW